MKSNEAKKVVSKKENKNQLKLGLETVNAPVKPETIVENQIPESTEVPELIEGIREISLGRISMPESEFPGDTAEHFEALITDVIANARQRGKLTISTSKLDGIVTSQLIITGYFY